MYRTVSGVDLGYFGQTAAATLPSVAPAAGVLATPAAAGPGEAAVIGLGGLLYTGVILTSTLFTYGVASSHPSKMVRTTGYILTGVGILGMLAAFGGTFIVAAEAANRRGWP